MTSLRSLKDFAGKVFTPVLIKYLINMAFTYPLLLLLTYFLTESMGLYYLLAYVIALCVTTVINFSLSMMWIFKVEGDVRKRFIKYVTVLVSFSAANVILVKISTEYAGLYYMASVVVVSGTLAVLKYITYKKRVFTP